MVVKSAEEDPVCGPFFGAILFLVSPPPPPDKDGLMKRAYNV